MNRYEIVNCRASYAVVFCPKSKEAVKVDALAYNRILLSFDLTGKEG